MQPLLNIYFLHAIFPHIIVIAYTGMTISTCKLIKKNYTRHQKYLVPVCVKINKFHVDKIFLK